MNGSQEDMAGNSGTTSVRLKPISPWWLLKRMQVQGISTDPSFPSIFQMSVVQKPVGDIMVTTPILYIQSVELTISRMVVLYLYFFPQLSQTMKLFKCSSFKNNDRKISFRATNWKRTEMYIQLVIPDSQWFWSDTTPRGSVLYHWHWTRQSSETASVQASSLLACWRQTQLILWQNKE